jgi:hypothetical protein
VGGRTVPASSLREPPETLARYGIRPDQQVRYGFSIDIDVVPAEAPAPAPATGPPSGPVPVPVPPGRERDQ